ncbi:ABC transporter substrate-binding protein [Methanolobus sp. WCC5]|uniref:ABC transporter substrate-binding protein n=1 Tax=Methanolobus sp. WCC5 TaxID=3125785 RepID=UPI00324A13E9
MRTGTIFIVILVALAILFAAGCADTETPEETEEEMIVVGIMGPYTGGAAVYGNAAKDGAMLAFEEADLPNVRIVTEDTKSETREAATAMNKMVSVDNVQAVIGDLISAATLAAAPIAEQNQVVMISPASTSTDISDAGDYIFRTIPGDDGQGIFAANTMHERGFTKLALLYTNDQYGNGLAGIITEEFTALGGEIVADETYEAGSSDMRTQLSKIKNSNPEVIYIVSNTPDSSVALLRQITEIGIDANIYGSEGLKVASILELGSSVEGIIITSVSPESEEFKQKYMDAYGEEAPAFAAQAYDAARAIIMAIEQGATTGEEIKNALYEMEFDGASGHIKFNEKGDVEGGYVLVEVQDGAFVTLEE